MKIMVHACGGAGINIAGKVVANVAELGEGFAEINIKYIDTSDNNISKIEHNPADFHQIIPKSYGTEKISGSGSERRTNADDIVANIKDYLDGRKIKSKVVGEYHIVVFSASGGSGSVIGPMMIKDLISKDIPTLAVVVGDSTNGLFATNTLNTLATLNHISTKLVKKPLNLLYVNNQTFAETGAKGAEDESNKRIFNSLSAISLFLSGVNGDLDATDMAGMIDPSHYQTFTVPPGLYGLATFSGEIELAKNAVPIVGRTLVAEGGSPDITLTLQHHKSGFVTESNALDIYGAQFPIHLVNYANFFTIERELLNKVVEDYKNVMKSIEIVDVEGSEDSNVDENGLVF